MMNVLNMVLELSKVRIASLATATALTGYVLGAGTIDAGAIAPIAGVFLLACGASALNQYQERDIDGLMPRTMNRPLPTGRMTAPQVLLVSVLLLALGCLCLSGNQSALSLGIVTVVWYNVIYTTLKRFSPFAAIPGGVVGSLPPIIGFVAAGGSMYDVRILAVGFFFFVWQVPHFWLLLMRIGEQYERAGLPTLTAILSRRQLARVTYVWMLATAAACLMLPMFSVANVPWMFAAFVVASVWLVWHATVMMRSDGEKLAFHQINIYALAVIVVLSASGFRG